MEKRIMLNASVSRLGMGNMRLPAKDGKIDYAAGGAMIDRLMAAGVTYYDTAWFYHDGDSERFCKAALTDRYPRESFYLADKMPRQRSLEDAERIFSEQLVKTGAGYFDFYLFHGINLEIFDSMQSLGIADFLLRMKREGKIKRLGMSYHGAHDQLDTLLGLFDFEFAQIQLNYFDWHKGASLEYDALVKRGLPIIVMEPVRGGMLASMREDVERLFREANPDASIASWALRWAAELEGVDVILSGMSTMEQAEDNIKLFENRKPMTQDEQAVIRRVLDTLDNLPLIPCTDCRYCKVCPKEIPIHELLGLYNSYIRFDNAARFTGHYFRWLPAEKRATACIECGQCEQKCPQHIKIIDELKRVHQTASELDH